MGDESRTPKIIPDIKGPKTAERLPALWPWLLIPLVAIALFFVLRALRQEL